ncbi:MAG: hypothetical protein IAE91_10110 [Ignavibacteriaceae bacterium]|nr:hypothetical protein [Ignavibacteriaceae bacterium]
MAKRSNNEIFAEAFIQSLRQSLKEAAGNEMFNNREKAALEAFSKLNNGTGTGEENENIQAYDPEAILSVISPKLKELYQSRNKPPKIKYRYDKPYLYKEDENGERDWVTGKSGEKVKNEYYIPAVKGSYYKGEGKERKKVLIYEDGTEKIFGNGEEVKEGVTELEMLKNKVRRVERNLNNNDRERLNRSVFSRLNSVNEMFNGEYERIIEKYINGEVTENELSKYSLYRKLKPVLQ